MQQCLEKDDMDKKEIFEKRKKVIYDMMCDRLYVPMKEKELAMILQVAKEDRPMLRELLSALMQEGKIEVSKHGNTAKRIPRLWWEPILPIQKDLGLWR